MRRALAGLALLLGTVPLRAEMPTVTLRGGNHPGFGRLVFDLPAGAAAAVSESNSRLLVQVTGGSIGTAPPLPRNLGAIEINGNQAALIPVPGGRWRVLRLSGRLAIDILDPPATAATPAPAAQPPWPRALWSGPPPRHFFAPPPAKPAAEAIAPPAAPPAASPSAPVPAPPAPVLPVKAAPLPPSGGATGPVALAATVSGTTLALPFAATTGAAAFRRGDEAVAVFDEARPLDLAAVRDDKTFGTARIDLLPAATVLRFVLPPGATLRLARNGAGWMVTETPEEKAAPLAPIRPAVEATRLLLPAAAPGRVVSVPDPATGVALLVGTQLQPGEGVAVARRAPDHTLLATFQGVAVEPLSDNDVLRAMPTGFVLEGDDGPGLALGATGAAAQAAADAARLTRRWDFPPLPAPALWHRLQAALDAAAGAPPQARAGRRLAAAQAELALGLDAEAEALARLAATEDARAAEGPDAAGLAAIAALLAGRDHESEAIEDPRLSGTDEVALWRAVRLARREPGAPAAASVFAATLPLLLAYPAPLRARLLPLAAETMVRGGEHEAARRLLASNKDDPSLDFARALLAETENHSAQALALYDRLARWSDRLTRARAAVRAVELRLRTGALQPAQAADALDRLI
jgi:hypothetical protein